jgi:hypothetical protein
VAIFNTRKRRAIISNASRAIYSQIKKEAGNFSRPAKWVVGSSSKLLFSATGDDGSRGRYSLFADMCLKKATIVKKALKLLRLPPARTKAAADAHYRCFQYLRLKG